MTTHLIPKHLVFRPSGAHRWLNCPGSAWVSTAVKTRSSSYAAEGTMAHAWLSHYLTGKPVTEFLKEDDKEIEIPPEDMELIKRMADLVQDMALLEGAELLVETKIHKVFADHRISGTADIILHAPGRLMIFDYKHGAGKKVKVESNPQITLYLLMAAAVLGVDIAKTDLEMGIIQPRGRGEGLTIWVPPQSYLENFIKNVEAAIRRAYVPDPAFLQGPWCWGCPGEELGACPSKLMSSIRFAVGSQEDPTVTPVPVEVTPAWWLLDYAKEAEKVAKNVSKEAVELIKEGGKVPGWTLKDKLGNRRWREPSEIPDVLARLSGADRREFERVGKPKPITISEARHHPALKGRDIEQYMERPLNRVLAHAEEVPESYLEEVE